MAVSNHRQFVVVDGEEGEPCDGIGVGSLVFSPDSRRVAYVGNRGNRMFVVIDGRRGKEYDGIVCNTLVFSPDSKHLAYIAQSNRKQFVVVDGVEGQPFADVDLGDRRRIIFDAPNEFHYVCVRKGYLYLIRERIE